MPKKKKNNEETTPAVEEKEPEASKGPESAGENAEAAPVSADTTPPTAEEELVAARAVAAKNWDLYLRSQAEFDNYRKRVQREKEDLARFANEAILREILPVVDNLERAVEHAGDKGSAEGLLEGVQMTLSQFQRVLDKFGVKPIQATGELFDPARHEAIGQVESRAGAAQYGGPGTAKGIFSQ